MDDNLNNVIFNSLLISDFGRKTFHEKDLENSTGIPKNEIIYMINGNEDIFNSTSLKTSVCLKCKSQKLDTETGICGGCGEKFENDQFSQYRIDIDKSAFEKKSLEFINELFENNNWSLKNQEHNLLLLKKDNYFLAVYFSLDNSTLKDYYFLKGWLSQIKNVCYLILSKSTNIELTNFASKNPLVHLEYCANIYQKKELELLQNKVNYSLENINQENQFEKCIEGTFKEELNIQKVQLEFSTILENLNNLALHNNNLSNSQNGYRYQDSIIKLLNLTILPIKVLAKQDIQDVLIRVPPNYGEIERKVRWVPLEIKSFRPSPKVGSYFNIKKYCSQFRKYIQGYLDTKVQIVAQVECFVIFAYDFLQNDEVQEAINQLEKDFKYQIHIALFPQDSLLYLISKRTKQKNPLVDYDHIVDLFRENRYIHKDAIDKLYTKIDTDFLDSGEEVTFKKVQERVHKMGK